MAIIFPTHKHTVYRSSPYRTTSKRENPGGPACRVCFSKRDQQNKKKTKKSSSTPEPAIAALMATKSQTSSPKTLSLNPGKIDMPKLSMTDDTKAKVKAKANSKPKVLSPLPTPHPSHKPRTQLCH